MWISLSFATTMYISVLADTSATPNSHNCRERSNHLRQDGGLCFEIPPWQHLPVELEEHAAIMRERFDVNDTDSRRITRNNNHLSLANSEISRYMDTVLAPFLDTYHRNIQNAYQQLTTKILKKIKEEIQSAIKKKQHIYNDVMNLIKELNVPEMCNEEKRLAKTISSNHVAQIYACTEDARASISKMGKYAEEMIEITKKHMQQKLAKVGKTLDANIQRANVGPDINICLRNLSRAAVKLGYELDLSLTNARRYNEQSCEKLSSCGTKVKRHADEAVTELKELLYQCVYA